MEKLNFTRAFSDFGIGFVDTITVKEISRAQSVRRYTQYDFRKIFPADLLEDLRSGGRGGASSYRKPFMHERTAY
jgi:hypothetical protein